MEDLVVCGLKITHDGAVAVVRGHRLVFATEMEKVGNGRRHAELTEVDEILAELAAFGIEPARVGALAVDGWQARPDGTSDVHIGTAGGGRHVFEVAGYLDPPRTGPGRPEPVVGVAPWLGGAPSEFSSFTHAAGHLFSAYSTSPWPAAGRSALGLVWDGGMPPVLHEIRPDGAFRVIRRVAGLTGALYPIFAAHFAPFRPQRVGRDPADGFGMAALFAVPGKAMAYAGLGKPDEEAIEVMSAVTGAVGRVETPMHCYQWAREAVARLAPLELSDATLIASLQEYLLRLLIRGLRELLDGEPDLRGLPIVMAGGCALNIKWNAAVRASGLFADVWVPPFPNDAGSAIGAACAEMARRSGRAALDWSPYAGPDVRWDGAVPPGWTGAPCSPEELGSLLHHTGEPVVVISGRAELGPRALGHRSILAAATDARMRDRLNEVKGREGYRPVAPMCLEEDAPAVFAPGGRDPYMLFDHEVRGPWADRVPAVVHVDGSARLQTVDRSDPLVHRILHSYRAASGIPVLCNTSANFPGRGFFPDPGSAMRWGRVDRVWSDGVLYHRSGG